MINQGRLQALSLCNFCHQDATPGAGEFTGQLQPRPMTMAYGTNLSPDMETGIGALTDEQIGRAARLRHRPRRAPPVRDGPLRRDAPQQRQPLRAHRVPPQPPAGAPPDPREHLRPLT